MSTSSILCQLNGGCMGCCGNTFVSKQAIKQAVHKNSLEYKNANPKTIEEFKKFRDRRKSHDLRSGVCRNLVNDSGCMICPLHPDRHKEDDLRENHCDVNYLCETAHAFDKWDTKKKKKFISFIASKKLDNITYSLEMDGGDLMKEFESKKSNFTHFFFL